MAAGKKKSALELLIAGAIVLVIVSIILIILLTPVLLVGGWIYYSIKLKQFYSFIQGNVADFWLTPDEKDAFKDCTHRYLEADKIIKRAWSKGERENVPTNQDGTFSARSRLGKELKATIEEYEPIREELLEVKESVEELPLERWKNFHDTYLRQKAFGCSCITWILALNVVAFFYPPDQYIDNLTRMIQFPLLFLDSKVTSADWDNVFRIIGTCIVAFLIKLRTEKHNSKKITPIPPQVTLENLDIDREAGNDESEIADITVSRRKRKITLVGDIPKKFIASFVRLRKGKPNKTDQKVFLAFLEEGHDILKWIRAILKDGGVENIKEEMKFWKETVNSIKAQQEAEN